MNLAIISLFHRIFLIIEVTNIIIINFLRGNYEPHYVKYVAYIEEKLIWLFFIIRRSISPPNKYQIKLLSILFLILH